MPRNVDMFGLPRCDCVPVAARRTSEWTEASLACGQHPRTGMSHTWQRWTLQVDNFANLMPSSQLSLRRLSVAAYLHDGALCLALSGTNEASETNSFALLAACSQPKLSGASMAGQQGCGNSAWLGHPYAGRGLHALLVSFLNADFPQVAPCIS
eukprot:361939-Chlamydomonas_euryale.AAC.3